MIRLRIILYHVCCHNRERLPGNNDDADDDDDDDDDAGGLSIADMAATDDEVAEIFDKIHITIGMHHTCTDTPYFMGTI